MDRRCSANTEPAQSALTPALSNTEPLHQKGRRLLGKHLLGVTCCQITPQLSTGDDPSGAEGSGWPGGPGR